MTLQEMQAWLGATPLATPVRDVVWVKALLESAHILGGAAILFSTGMIAARLAGVAARSEASATLIRRFAPWTWAGLAVMAATGLTLLTGAGRRGLDNPMFAVKATTLFCAILATALMQLAIGSDPAFWELNGSRRAIARVLAPVAFLLWIATVLAGRWLAYSSTFFAPAY